MPDHPLKNKWFVHCYVDRPWQSVSDLDEAAANAIAVRTGKTFDGSYYRRRCEIEAWDRDMHIARGGMVHNANPVYAMLCDEILQDTVLHAEWIAIAADSVEPSLISLSIGDSFIAYEIAQSAQECSDGMGLTHDPLSFMNSLNGRSFPTDWPAHINACGNPFYIEARLYTRALPGPCAAAFYGARESQINHAKPQSLVPEIISSRPKDPII